MKASRYDAGMRRAEKRGKKLTPELAQFKGALLAVHGFNTRGTWQKEIGPVLQEASIMYESLDYGLVLVGIALPGTVGQIIPSLIAKYEALKRFHERPSVVAHSFGSHVLRRSLEQNPSLSFRRIILVAGVVPRDYPWSYFQQRQQVEKVLNEACASDLPPKLARFFVWRNAGSCGAYGFASGGTDVQNCLHWKTGHSTLLTRLHCREAWVPFILRGRFPPGCQPAKG